jgi:hypothetical protein
MLMNVAGKPFFPIGLFDAQVHIGYEFSPNSARLNAESVDNLLPLFQEIKKCGFNSIRYSPWYGYRKERDMRVMEIAEEVGIKVWIAPRLDEPVFDWLVDHPKFVMWELMDEPVWNKCDYDMLLDKYMQIKTVDLAHPVWINHAPRNSLVDIRRFNNACDVTGIDIYPYYKMDQGHFSNKDITVVGDYARWMHTSVNHSKPVIMVLQGYLQNVNLGPMRPTYEELRFMVYDSIVNRCAGIVFFGTSGPYGGSNWDAVIPIVRELSMLESVLLSEELPLLVYAWPLNRPDCKVQMLMKKYDDEVYIIAVNRSSSTVDVRFEGVDWTDKSDMRVLFENRAVSIDKINGAFSDRFRGFDVHIYTTSAIQDELGTSEFELLTEP